MLSKILKPVVMGKVVGSDGNGGGVGVGIVAALQKSQGVRRKLAVCVPNSNPSSNSNLIHGKHCEHTSGSIGHYDDHKFGNININIITRKNKKRVFDNYMSPPPPPSTQDVIMMRPFLTSDFLSSCDLCQKNLHGKDIYMYRGEKAFCSMECRYRQIVMDEHKEQYQSSQASISSAHVSDQSPYTCNNSYTDSQHLLNRNSSHLIKQPNTI